MKPASHSDPLAYFSPQQPARQTDTQQERREAEFSNRNNLGTVTAFPDGSRRHGIVQDPLLQATKRQESVIDEEE